MTKLTTKFTALIIILWIFSICILTPAIMWVILTGCKYIFNTAWDITYWKCFAAGCVIILIKLLIGKKS